MRVCYLLITYYSPDIYLENLDGIEYNILTRIWEPEKLQPQIVNIPLNEYVFGTIDYYNNNYHHYSLYIPESNNITIEIQGRNIYAVAKHGIIKINPFNENAIYIIPDVYDDVIDFEEISEKIENEKLIITIDKQELKVESLENQYISLVFTVLDNIYFDSLINFYYFRIIQDNFNNSPLYPLDTNKANICRTSNKGEINSCYFLMKNDYKELNNYNISIYAYGIDEANYNVWYINDKETDYYSIDINNIRKYEKIEGMKGYTFLDIKNDTEFILIEIYSDYIEDLNVYINYQSELIPSPSIDIYSYQIFYLISGAKKDYYFNLDFLNEYTIFLNSIYGEGNIYFNQNYTKKVVFSNDMVLSFTISEKIQSIHIFSKKNLFFSLKLKNKIYSDISDELNYGSNIIDQTGIKAFYIKDIYDRGLDINFYLEFENITHYYAFSLVGYELRSDEIKYISGDYLYNLYIKEQYEGFKYIYDSRAKSGLITFDKMSENKLNNKDKYYLFYYFFADINSNTFQNASINSEINIESKYSVKVLKINKYIRGYFDLLNNNTRNITYYILNNAGKENMNKTFILEFSSNCKDVKLIFNKDFDYYKKRIFGGVKQYFISGEKLIDKDFYYFDVQVNNSNAISKKKFLDFANYIIKFSEYKNEKYQNCDLKKELKFHFEVKSNTNEDLKNYYFTISLDESNKNSNQSYEYHYFFTFIPKIFLFDNELLNTTAIIIYNDKTFRPHLHDFKTNEPKKEYSFSYDLDSNEDHFIQIFIKINGLDGSNETEKEESYYSTFVDLTEKKEDKLQKTNKILTIVVITLVSLLLVLILLFIFFMIKFKRKNKNLKEKVEAISFSTGIESDSLDKASNNNFNLKKDEDYDNTFI